MDTNEKNDGSGAGEGSDAAAAEKPLGMRKAGEPYTPTPEHAEKLRESIIAARAIKKFKEEHGIKLGEPDEWMDEPLWEEPEPEPEMEPTEPPISPDKKVELEEQARKIALEEAPTATWISREAYERIKALYLQFPEQHSTVAQHAKIPIRYVKKAWDTGWPKIPWAVAIEPVVMRELQLTRAIQIDPTLAANAAKRKKEIEEAERAREQAAVARQEEANALRMGRANVLGTLAALSRIQPALQTYAERLAAELKTVKVDVLDGAELLDKVAGATRKLTKAIDELMEAERTYLGEPSKIVGVVALTPEEAMASIERAREAAFRLRNREVEEDELLRDVTPTRALPPGEK